MKHSLRFRQVHLDFHTSPKIFKIGSAFDKRTWQERLKLAHIDSITCFATCHHGWSYYDTAVGQRHPNLSFDLLRAQFDACKEIDVNVPIYLTAGINNWAAYNHPEWREVDFEGRYTSWGKSPVEAGFHTLCFNTPYLDLLCEQIREVVRLFPDCDGIFLDIIRQSPCVCRWCLDGMAEASLKAEIAADRMAWSKRVLLEYYRRTTEAARSGRPDMPIMHNSGHVSVGERNLLKYFSHLELESLPTGGWGYDHFPMSAAFARTTGHDFLGMTGKFHTSWGEFGGYKHPNALRYECAAMIANGAKCSVGDQLHPLGELDETTCRIIGEAYREVEQKEPWCVNAAHVSDIGLLASAAVTKREQKENPVDTGAGRLLLESHFLFDVLDLDSDFSKYKLLILPDDIRLDESLAARLNQYLAQGGKLLLSGQSGLNKDGDGFALDIGANDLGEHEFNPSYLCALPQYRADFLGSPLVMYKNARKLELTSGSPLGEIQPPYFNRHFRHFCSHQHAPNNPDGERFPAGVITENIAYISYPIFTIYCAYGAVAYREFVARVIRQLLAGNITIESNLPASARLFVTRQESAKRFIVHLLFATPSLRGCSPEMAGPGVTGWMKPIEVIEDLLPLHDTTFSIRTKEKITCVRLEPQGEEIPFAITEDAVQVTVDTFSCHQLVVLSY